MGIPLSWIHEYVEVKDIPIANLRWRLDLAGLEVGKITAIGYAEAELPWDPEKVVTAEVVAVRPHPNADRLVLGEVNYGGPQHEIVVTGAPSLYAYSGQEGLHLKVAFAWEGATLYDGHAEGWTKRKLKPSSIRGVPSRAMVCSEKELGLADVHGDIIYLPEDTPVGVPLVEVLGDYVIEFDIKGPFGHLQSVYGIAREIAALYDRPIKRDPLRAAERLRLQRREHPDAIKLEIPAPDLCPRYTATMIRDVKVGPSPLWMQTRLLRAGMRPINNIVDITNYVMWELGQPLHAFDYARLRPKPGETQPAIIVRRAYAGEQMQTLDGELRTFDDQMLLITDGGGPVGIAGVMGGQDSEVGEQTQDILLEAAGFNFINIRRTSQRLKLFTEASTRFGKRVDPELALVAGARAAELMTELAGGRVEQVVGDLYPGATAPTVIAYDPQLADRLLGIEVPHADQVRTLEALEFQVSIPEGQRDHPVWQVKVPTYRLDVRLPVDLVEEIARIWGYERFPSALIDEPPPLLRRNIPLEEEERIRDIVVRMGLDEVITYSLIDPNEEQRLLADPSQELPVLGSPLTLQNYLSPERSQLRRTLLPGMLNTAWSNLRFLDRVMIAEIGRIHYKVGEPDPAAGETGVKEPRRLSMLLTGPRGERWWTESADQAASLDYFDLKGIVEALLKQLALEDRAQWKRGTHPAFHPGRCAEVSVGDRVLGVLGELHPLVRATYDLPEQPVAVLEWDLEALLDVARDAEREKKISAISIYAPVYEDLALVVDEEVAALDVQRAILEAGKPLVLSATLFDTYRGEQVGVGKKSLAFALVYQSPGRSLEEHDVTKLRERIVKVLGKQLGAKLRGA